MRLAISRIYLILLIICPLLLSKTLFSDPPTPTGLKFLLILTDTSHLLNLLVMIQSSRSGNLPMLAFTEDSLQIR